MGNKHNFNYKIDIQVKKVLIIQNIKERKFKNSITHKNGRNHSGISVNFKVCVTFDNFIKSTVTQPNQHFYVNMR